MAKQPGPVEVAHDTLLVVGGTGFIGRAIVESALKQNFTVTVLSKKSDTACDTCWAYSG